MGKMRNLIPSRRLGMGNVGQTVSLSLWSGQTEVCPTVTLRGF